MNEKVRKVLVKMEEDGYNYKIWDRNYLLPEEVHAMIYFLVRRVVKGLIEIPKTVWVGLIKLFSGTRIVAYSFNGKDFYIMSYGIHYYMDHLRNEYYHLEGWTTKKIDIPDESCILDIKKIFIPESNLIVKKRKEREERKRGLGQRDLKYKFQDYFREKYKNHPILTIWHKLFSEWFHKEKEYEDKYHMHGGYDRPKREADKYISHNKTPFEVSIFYLFKKLYTTSTYYEYKLGRALARELFTHYPESIVIVKIEMGRDNKIISRRLDGKIYFIDNIDKINKNDIGYYAVGKVLIDKDKWGKIKIEKIIKIKNKEEE